MPELIEVELYRRSAQTCVGRTIIGVDAPDAWYLKGCSGPQLRAALVGATITGTRRRGKLLLVDTALETALDVAPDTGPTTLGLRFGMTGRLVVDGDAVIDELLYSSHRDDPAFDRFAPRFSDGGRMVMSDPRRLGGVELDPDIGRLGPDASTLTMAELRHALAGSASPLKARLLDQARIAGIGNLLADEILWRAGLSPLRPASPLALPLRRRLHAAITSTVADLLDRGGSHLGDLIDARHPGGRCPRCATPLHRSTVGGRTTWWCPREQR